MTRTCQNDTGTNLGGVHWPNLGQWSKIRRVTDYSSGKLHNLLFPQKGISILNIPTSQELRIQTLAR